MSQLNLHLASAPTDLVGRLRRLGLSSDVEVRLQENRRVMASFDRAGVLRVHRGYAHAPDHIVAALARWARRGTRRTDRRAAARAFLEFRVHDHVPPSRPQRRRPEPAAAGDPGRIDRLQALHRLLNDQWFDGALRPISIALSARMRRKLGHYEPAAECEARIVVSRRHLARDGWAGLADTLLHEMVHQWQDEQGLPVDHGPAFRRKAMAVGIAPRAVVAA